jgi:peptidyl-dipeptidase A
MSALACALVLVRALLVAAPSPGPARTAEDFLRLYNSLLIGFTREASNAAWAASTDVSPAHAAARTTADTLMATFQGDRTVIDTARTLLAHRQMLGYLAQRQLQKILLAAAEGPGTIPEVTRARVAAEVQQQTLQDGYTYHLDGKPVTANDLDDVLTQSRDLAARLRAWDASKEIGRPLRPGLVELVRLRNQVAREMKHPSYFALKVADFDMTEREMMDLMDGFVADIRPLYQKLHALVRWKLAERYHQAVPSGLIPAHWIPNRWAQEWDGISFGRSLSLDDALKGRTAEWIVRTAERFYVSMGFVALPRQFWERSDLYPVPAGQSRKKNQHASAWHIDLESDVRSLMSVKPNDWWFGAAHHELGHIYYYLSYTRPEVPPLLRTGLNRAMHECVGDLAAMASKQTPYLKALGLSGEGAAPDASAVLLEEALATLPFVSWAAGTMAHFERDLYSSELPAAEWQRRWWDYAARYQGVEPPRPRPADACDACTKTHVNDHPAEYYHYAMSYVLRYQLHDHICRKILKQDPHACSYYGSREVGDFLRSILRLGATRPWRDVIREATGEPLSTRALREYYAPLEPWLDQELAGRKVGW